MPSTPQRGRQRRFGRIELDQALARNRAVKLPAMAAKDIIARLEGGVARAHDLADDPAFHDRADFDRFGIGACRTDATAHIGVERQIDAAHQDLAVAGVRDRGIGNREIGGRRHADRPALQQDLAILVFHPLASFTEYPN